MILYRANRWIIHDRTESTIEILSSIEGDDWVSEIEDILNQGVPLRNPPAPPRAREPSTETDAVHAQKVRRTQDAIRAGVLYQLNYGRTWYAEIESTWDLFNRLERDNPAPLSAWLN